jgi:MFS family permease
MHRVLKRNPSRVFLLNILGALIIGAILGSVVYPVYLAGRLTENPGSMKQVKGWPPWSSDFWADPKNYFGVYTYIPIAVLGTVLIARMLLLGRELREIPKYVELTEDGVRIGRWLSQEEYIPYLEITEVYERPFYGYALEAVCFRTFGNGSKKICILKYAYDDWEELYRQLRERIGLLKNRIGPG